MLVWPDAMFFSSRTVLLSLTSRARHGQNLSTTSSTARHWASSAGATTRPGPAGEPAPAPRTGSHAAGSTGVAGGAAGSSSGSAAPTKAAQRAHTCLVATNGGLFNQDTAACLGAFACI